MKNEEKPLVSIVITNYNYSKYLYQSIESAINQTYKNTEILLIDDASTDNSEDVWKKFSGSIRVIKHAKNKGIVFSRNEALSKVKGDFLCFLDADDYFDSTYIEKMVEVAEASGADVVYPNWRVFGEDNYIKEYSDFDVQKLIRQEIHCTSESLIRLSSVKDHKFESGEVAEDWDFFLGLALDGRKFKLAKNCYINYRVRKNTRGTSRPYWEDVYKFISILEKWQKKYPDIVNPIDLPIYSGIVRDQQIALRDETIRQKDGEMARREDQMKEMEKTIYNIISSKSYRISRVLSKVVHFSKIIEVTIKKSIRSIFVKAKLGVLEIQSRREKERQYNMIHIASATVGKHKKTHVYAVILHLFYNEQWDKTFKEPLVHLYEISPFDLYINIPNDIDGSIEKKVRKLFPNVCVVKFPNRGRDVLPFVVMFRSINDKKYIGVLKLHSKISNHTKGGSVWVDEMLKGLIPDDNDKLQELLSKLESSRSVIGIKSVFVPLSVYLSANKKSIESLLQDTIKKDTEKNLGFFAGTMFWISGEYPYLDTIDIDKFEDEMAQTDGTYAHAIERYISVKPQIEKDHIFGINGSGDLVELSSQDMRAVDEINDWEGFIKNGK